jgi:hypothetical protein
MVCKPLERLPPAALIFSAQPLLSSKDLPEGQLSRFSFGRHAEYRSIFHLPLLAKLLA